MSAWAHAERIRGFVAAVEAEARRRGGDESVEMRTWAAWARSYAAEIDPAGEVAARLLGLQKDEGEPAKNERHEDRFW